MRAITMTVTESNHIVSGDNKWIWRRRGPDVLPPSVKEFIAIHSSAQYPDDPVGDRLRGKRVPSEFSGQLVAVAFAGKWQYSGDGQYHFSLEDVKVLPVPIPCVGALGFWRLTPDVEQKIWDYIGLPMPMVR